jgi:hypothetical protein
MRNKFKTHYFILKSFNRNGIAKPVIKLAVATDDHKGQLNCDNNSNMREPILAAIAIFKTKSKGSRISLPLKNNLAENQPISIMMTPNNFVVNSTQ